ncbi:hypothetical protein JKG47_20285 [Acidithiobacillus sp. MC6.1]|nr:hypothetical protein [Acidithiobacillus sp. MC6.1]
MSKERFTASLAPQNALYGEMCGLHLDAAFYGRATGGAAIDYAHLFVYLFRRFGYPNRGWDDYKELTKYVLTTPKPDCFLEVVPTPGVCALPQVHFTVWAHLAVFMAEQEYRLRPAQERWQRMMDWQEAQGLPEWMPELAAFARQRYSSMFGPLHDERDWRDCLRFAEVPVVKGDSEDGIRLKTLIRNFLGEMTDRYAEVEPLVEQVDRSSDWREWADDDPLKPYGAAVEATLLDLRRTVSIRDVSITAFGEPLDGEVDLAKSSGYPSGYMGNINPLLVAKLQGRIEQMGNGDLEKGLQMAVDDSMVY